MSIGNRLKGCYLKAVPPSTSDIASVEPIDSTQLQSYGFQAGMPFGLMNHFTQGHVISTAIAGSGNQSGIDFLEQLRLMVSASFEHEFSTILAAASRNINLERQLATLEKRVNQLAARRTFIVPITFLTPEPFVLLKDIPLTIEGDGEDFTATWLEANISASAESEADAIVNFKDCLVSRFEILEKIPVEKMGPLPKRQWQILNSVVQRK